MLLHLVTHRRQTGICNWKMAFQLKANCLLSSQSWRRGCLFGNYFITLPHPAPGEQNDRQIRLKTLPSHNFANILAGLEYIPVGYVPPTCYRTGESLSGGLSLTEMPLDRDPLDRTETSWTETLLDRDPLDRDSVNRDPPPWTETPLDRETPVQRPHWTDSPLVMWPVVHAGTEIPLWTESQTGVKTLPCHNFVVDAKYSEPGYFIYRWIRRLYQRLRAQQYTKKMDMCRLFFWIIT